MPTPRSVKNELQKNTDVTVGEKKIKFLTENMAMCEGEFSKRHKAQGASTERAPVKSDPRPGVHFRGTVSAPPSSRGAREAQKSQVRVWEPLSLCALLEYKAPQAAHGSGDFLSGQTRKWKVL